MKTLKPTVKKVNSSIFSYYQEKLVYLAEYTALKAIEPYLAQFKSGEKQIYFVNKHVSTLYLSDALPPDLFPEIGFFTHLTTIHFRNLDSLTCFTHLSPTLEWLHIESKHLLSFEGFPSHLDKLQVLLIKCPSLHTLEGLPSILDSLQSLSISCKRLKSLKGLPESSPSLRNLGIWDTPIESLGTYFQQSFLLEGIGLENVPINNLHKLPCELNHLEKLDLTNCAFPNLEGLPLSLPRLEKMYIGIASDRGNYEHPTDGYDLIPFHSVQGFPQETPLLEELSIIGTALTSLKGLTLALPRLNHLIISYNPLLVSMQGLPNELPNMEWFDMDNNGLRDFQFFPRLPGALEYLSFKNNPFQSLLGMSEHVLIEKHRKSEIDRVFRLPLEFSRFELITLHTSSFAALVANIARFDLMDAEFVGKQKFPRCAVSLNLTPKGFFLLKKVWDFHCMNYEAIYDETASMDYEIATLKVPRECTPESFMFFKTFPSLFLPPDYQIYFDQCDAHRKKCGCAMTRWDFDDPAYFAEASVIILLKDETGENDQIFLHEAFMRELYAYYQLSPMELAQKYVVEHYLSDDERERLLYEKNTAVIRYLLRELPETDPILVKILE
ncbi:hypothetical protein NEF87_004917 [Candidatus Lokiarchaeum ossiferum]|uniref:Leucine-rich repeat domain-containing protein n=1 Tax=Candidatus Lokiarchaeum ossiferum TaxID=2951803 RepID=A0ABY6HYN3_9ARCH|nr:hypothetical protein NEF87_004917 [Candidatus Lokiarchaeum sp. B-35]